MAELEQVVTEQTFEPIRPEELVAELGVESRARQDAKKEYPAEASSSLSATEQTILDAIHSRILSVRVLANERLATLARQRLEIDLPARIADLEATSRDLEGEYRQLVAETNHKLRAIREEEAARHKDLLLFQSENSLRREAVLPTSSMLHWSLITFIVVIESVLNSYFFGKGSEFGLLGGWLQAGLISGVNVCFAIMLGANAVRWLSHVKFPQKMIGALGFVLYIAFVLVSNLLVAHYRALLENDPFTAIVAAVESFQRSPFGIQNVDAWLLFAVGIASSMLAIWKSLTHIDVYPGYTAVALRYREAQERLDAAQEEVAQRVKERHEKATGLFEEKRSQTKKELGRFQSAISTAEGLSYRYKQFVIAAQGACNDVFGRYRSTNKAVRHTPPPAYFDQTITLDPTLSDFQLDVSGERLQLADMIKRYDRFSEAIPAIRQKMSDAYAAALQDLQRSAALTREMQPSVRNEPPRVVQPVGKASVA